MADQGAAVSRDKKKQEPAQPRSKKFPMATVLVLLSVLFLEGAGISAVFFLAGRPADVSADSAAVDQLAQLEQPVEVPLLAERFQNTLTGRAYIFDTDIYVVVRRKHEQKVRSTISEMTAQITTDVATVFRQAEPAHLREPTLATLTRQIKAVMDDRFGRDPDTDKPYLEKVLIRKCVQFRADA